ncbi:MAG: sugar ABC transporter permease [Chloroflexota bacterium]|nr:sugar ABC transporter permease [Chloroflexota bacterium]
MSLVRSNGIGSAQSRRSNLLMALPVILILLVFSLYPFFYTLSLSVTESALARPFQEFIWLDNFRRGLEDSLFQTSIVNTLVYGFTSASLQLVLGFVLALFFYKSVKAGKYLRTLALFPFITPPVAVAMIWRLIYEPNSGLINYYLGQLGINPSQPIAWLGDPNIALLSLVIIDVWQWTPFVFLLALAALQALPHDPYEAAAVDGASAWQAFTHLTLPMAAPALIVIYIIRLIGAFKIFDQVYLLTFGGPGSSTQVASFYIYRAAFQQFDTGYASALTIILLVVLSITVAVLTSVRNRVRARYE